MYFPKFKNPVNYFRLTIIDCSFPYMLSLVGIMLNLLGLKIYWGDLDVIPPAIVGGILYGMLYSCLNFPTYQMFEIDYEKKEYGNELLFPIYRGMAKIHAEEHDRMEEFKQTLEKITKDLW